MTYTATINGVTLTEAQVAEAQAQIETAKAGPLPVRDPDNRLGAAAVAAGLPNSSLEVRKYGNLKGRGLFLPPQYNWTIVTDNEDIPVLTCTRKP